MGGPRRRSYLKLFRYTYSSLDIECTVIQVTRRKDDRGVDAHEPAVLKATPLIVVAGAILAAAITAFAVFWPEAFGGGRVKAPPGDLSADQRIELETARVDARSNARETGLKLAAGAGALTAGLLAWGRMELSRDERRMSRAVHFDSQYAKAVEQIGHDNADVQLGGLYALEQLARHSEDHQRPSVEVLCAFVREHAEPVMDAKNEPMKQPVTVQAALTILSRNREDWHYPYDLSGADLRASDMRETDFPGTNFDRCDLGGVNFKDAILVESTFVGCSLLGASFEGADLLAAYFSEADLTAVSFDFARMHLAGLAFASLRHASLEGADLRNATLTRADLTDASLFSADLTEANLWLADLTRADLSESVYVHTRWPDGFDPPRPKVESGRSWREGGYALDSGVELHEAHPDTFDLPDEAARMCVPEGVHVKLIFLLRRRSRYGHWIPHRERMWVDVEKSGGGEYVGLLINRPVLADTDLRPGHRIKFRAEHIIDIEGPDDAYSRPPALDF